MQTICRKKTLTCRGPGFSLAMIIPIAVLGTLLFSVIKTSGQTCNEGHMEFTEPNLGCCAGDTCVAYIGIQICFSCAAKNFCKAEWIKNGNSSVSFDYRDSATYYDDNTTLVFPSPSSGARGNYTCVLSNDTTSITRDFYLGPVCEKEEDIDDDFVPVPHELDDGKCSDVAADIGHNVTLYCEFCAKSLYYQTILQWRKWRNETVNGTDVGNWTPIEELDIEGTSFETERKELHNCGSPTIPYVDPDCEKKIDSVGSFLYIKGVSEGSFGQYKLVALLETTNKSSTTEPISVTPKVHIIHDKTGAVLGSLGGLLVVSLLVAVLYYEFNLDVQLFFRDRFGSIEIRGLMSYDAFIVYDSGSEQDRTFVLEVIRPMLLENNYEVFVKDIDTTGGSFHADELLNAMDNSLRCILLVSPTLLSSRHTILQIDAAVGGMMEHRTKIIPILFGGISIRSTRGHHEFNRLLLVLRCLRYQEGRTTKRKFLKKLRLRMPRRSSSGPNNGQILLQHEELSL